jgi:hypothetical protein
MVCDGLFTFDYGVGTYGVDWCGLVWIGVDWCGLVCGESESRRDLDSHEAAHGDADEVQHDDVRRVEQVKEPFHARTLRQKAFMNFPR